MTQKETRVLIGCFLGIIGIFLPWYSVQPYFPGPDSMVQDHQQILFGYQFIAGWVLLAALALTAGLILGPGIACGSRRRAAALFTSAIALGITLSGGFLPLFLYAGTNPHLGLLSLLIGTILCLITLRRMS